MSEQDIHDLYEPLVQFVEHIAQNGIPCDTSPTLGGRLGDGTEPSLWYQYLRDVEQLQKNQARRILETHKAAVRDRNAARAALDRPRANEGIRRTARYQSQDMAERAGLDMGRAIAEAEQRRAERDQRIEECDHLLNSSGWCQKNCGFVT